MTTEPTTTGKTLVKKLAEVMKEVGRIPKNGHNDHFNYSFVRESDLVEAISDKLAERNVIVTPTKKRTEVIEMAKVIKGGEVVTMKVGLLHVTFTFRDGDTGETIEAESVGEIEQDGGKGIYKAATGAKKYMLLESFLVATGDDPENDGGQKKQARTSETANATPPKPRQEQTPRQPASATPQQLGYIEKLAKEKGLYDPKNLFAPFGVQGQPSKAQATKIIDQLKAIKVGPQKAPARAA